jgi:hypothetical protein
VSSSLEFFVFIIRDKARAKGKTYIMGVREQVFDDFDTAEQKRREPGGKNVTLDL